MSQVTKILVIEDEVLFARAVQKCLQKAGFECEHAETVQEGYALVKQFSPDFVLLDMRLPDGNGLDMLPDLVASGITVIVMTAYGEISEAVNAIKLGATDYLKKPIDLEELLLIVQKNQKTAALKTSLDHARQRDAHAAETVNLVGESATIRNVRAQIARIAALTDGTQSASPVVLIAGETGSGKDVVARMLHAASANSSKPFVHVDCASLAPEQMESELFGHEKGAFLSANVTRHGLIEAAEEGALFIDEVADLPLAMQAKLLHVIERGKVRRMGSTTERDVTARLIVATNRNLSELVSAQKFRSDLYQRLQMLCISIAPLRERGGDVVLLAKYFMRLTEKRYDLKTHMLSPTAIEALLTYTWPGNVRELRQLISRVVLFSHQQQISAADLALPTTKFEQQVVNYQVQLSLDAAEKNMLLRALDAAHGNVSEAARKLDVTRMTMRYRMDKHNIIL